MFLFYLSIIHLSLSQDSHFPYMYSDCTHLILPPRCQCYHSGNESQLHCYNIQLDFIPKLPNNMRWHTLDFSLNHIKTIPSYVFSDIYVEKIDLHTNHLQTIDETAFGEIQNLKQLFMNHNQLKEFNPNILTSPGVTLVIYKKGYQAIDTSIISSVTSRVKGLGSIQTDDNHTLVIDGADYIAPPQENNALFLMTNFIRTDQKYTRCEESPFDQKTACPDNAYCQTKNYRRANGKWTGRCLFRNDSSANRSRSPLGRCELEGWCPVENDVYLPEPIRDALNFTIYVKNFIEFPRFKVIRKNFQLDANYLRSCNYDSVTHKTCPVFRVGTLLDIVESNPTEQHYMLKLGAVIRVKIDWNCNLDKSLDFCLPEYSFTRLDAADKEQSFAHGFNFRFASHWKHQNRSYRTLTKAYGLRFIISVSGYAGRFDLMTLALNIGSLVGILGLVKFICDCVAFYVHPQ
ncbi:unnamed protein product [Adineta steineri]|uniref:ATP receptor n=1 Tax=Adineta steineri TaxID=433720 RepID=A0A815S8H8_9BILA|nr:unnamed protein product [Adineta steineri]CAF1487166.1 unnamed protein product [Adineta steineri]